MKLFSIEDIIGLLQQLNEKQALLSKKQAEGKEMPWFISVQEI